MHNLWVFYYFFQKSLFAENNFLIAAINLTTWGPLYTCLVFLSFLCHGNTLVMVIKRGDNKREIIKRDGIFQILDW